MVKESLEELRDRIKELFNGAIKKSLGELRGKTKDLFNDTMKDKLVRNKYKITLTLTALIVGSLFILGAYQAGNCLSVTFNGREIGLVKSEKDFQEVLLQVNEEVNQSMGEGIRFNQEASFEKARLGDGRLSSAEDLKAAIYDNIQLKKSAAAIRVNGEEIVVVQDRETAEEILDEIKKPYSNAKDNVEVKQVDFSDKVEVVETQVSLEKILPKEKALTYLQQGTDEVEVYQVVSGDTTWDISRTFGLGLREIEMANPGIDLENLQPGDELNLTVAKPFIDVRTIQEFTYTEQIPYKTTYKDDGSIYKGQQRVVTPGKYGTREVRAEVTYVNGVEESRNILEEKVLKEPTTQVVAKGIKPIPPAQGTGKFKRPTSGRNPGPYGRFGARRPGGRRHNGIDISNRTGTPIYASDGGTVTSYTGYRSGYGYVVEINHGAGYTSIYAHLSKVLVQPGQRVAKGDLIGRMGSTGRSSGPHLHFEIRKNGVPKNPFNYIR